jgi:hypothetical protein
MSELKKNFVQGKMNKDFDVRLIPEGEYIDAFNVLVSNSEDSQVGSVQNSFGLDKLSYLTLPSDAETIGSASDEGNEKIYWCVATNSGASYIFEYDQLNSGLISTVLEDTRAGSNNVLNFKKQYKITGFNVIYNSFNKETLLVLTDDLNGIRCINVNRAKTYGPSTPSINTFSSQDISLYKRQPHFAPICTPTITGDGSENNIKERFLSFGYRWKYLDGEYSAISTFSNPQFYPGKFHLDYQTNENLGMVNLFNAVNIKFKTGDRNVTDVQLVFKESNSNNVWIIDTFNKGKLSWNNEDEKSFTFSNNKIYSVLPEDEVNRLFDNVPIVAKAQDFIGNRLIYGNYVEGRDLVNSLGNNINIDYNVTFKSESLSSIAVPSSRVTTTNTNDTLELDLSSSSIKKGEVLTISFRATSPSPFFGNYLFEQSLFLENTYTNALALQTSPEFQNFIANVCTINFKNYDTSSIVPISNLETTYYPFEILASTDITKIRIRIPSIRYKISNTPTYVYELFSIYSDTNIVTLSNGNAYSSCKSNRSYEVGIVYLDDDGRYSTVITNQLNSTNNCFIPVLNSVTKNTLVLNIKHKAPVWAKKYKAFVKDSKLDYQTIYGIVAYRDDNHVWFKLEGQDKNKVKDGDSLIIKKNIDGVNQGLFKTEVLEYKQQSFNFIDESINPSKEFPGNYMKLKNYGDVYNNQLVSLNFSQRNVKGYGGVDSYFLYIRVAKYDELTSSYVPLPITAGSKININISNNRITQPDPREFVKEYTVQNNYPSFKAWFETEANGLGVFTHYQFNDTGLYANMLRVWNLIPGITEVFTNAPSYMDGEINILSASGVVIFETDPKDKTSEVYYETPDTYLIDSNGNHLSNSSVTGDISQDGAVNAKLNLSFFNCYTQGNGAESYIVKDLFNANFLSTNTRPNAVELDGYKERRNIASLTYSGGFEKTTNYNSLNEFNLSRANYKDLDDKYGTIQKIFSRDTDLIVFQEDKLHKILYNKNLLSDAVGGGQITSVEQVLGQEIPFIGEWGIGTNPETFSNYANNIYFADQPKGVILRLGGDGLEPISRYGMKDWFRDNLRDYSSKFIIGGFDPSYDNYIVGFTDEVKQIDTLKIGCNQEVSKLLIPAGGSITYDINIGNKIGDYTFKYDIPVGELDVTVTIGDDQSENVGLSEDGNIIITRRSTVETANVYIANNGIIDSRISFSNSCPRTDELEVITLVVNDSFEAGRSMKNQYTWVDSTYGYSGGSYDTDVFDSSGLTRFSTQIGMESDGPIPIEGSLLRVSSIKVSGEFTSCNKIGYIITSDTLDASEILASATYIIPDTLDDENFIQFIYERDGDLTKKLYIVWDYIDNIEASTNNILKTINIGEVITINALDNITLNESYAVYVSYSGTNGSVGQDGDNITYSHNGDNYDSDYFIYYVFIEPEEECYVEIRVDIIINAIHEDAIPCYNYTIYAGLTEANSVTYIDCGGDTQTALADGITSGPVETAFCARQLVGPYNNVTTQHVICS